MSFINKFIDKAKSSRHNSSNNNNNEQVQQQQQQQQQNNTLNKSNSSITSTSTASSSHQNNVDIIKPSSHQQQQQQQDDSSSHHHIQQQQQQQLQDQDVGLKKAKEAYTPTPMDITYTNNNTEQHSIKSYESYQHLQQVPQQVPQQRRPPQQSTYTSVYNDQSIIKQRQDRPRLKLADFNMLRTLGTGSFGRVHLVQSRVNARYYAIKVLKKSEVVRLKQVEHTNNEKHILESVAHPFLVNMWGTFQDNVNLFMVMDYVPGGELFSVLRRSKRFPDHVAKFYAAEVILAIEYMHSKNVIYRDLKPENLLLDSQGHIKITDFGFAKHVPDITWTLCGTPDYLAPEIIQSKGYGKAVDWWSLGVLVFEMLAGFPPFYDDDHLKLYEKILAGRVKYPQYFIPNSKDLLKRLLTSDLTKRYGNLKDGSEDIKRHVWFQGVDFNRVLARQIRPPYVPSIRGEGDASHFDRYPETDEQYGNEIATDPFRHLFPDF